MIRHIAVFTFTDEVTDEDIGALDVGLAALPGLIDEILSYSFGRDLGLSDGTFDYGVIGDFDSADSFRIYSTHSEHVRVMATCVKPILKDVVRVQMEV